MEEMGDSTPDEKIATIKSRSKNDETYSSIETSEVTNVA